MRETMKYTRPIIEMIELNAVDVITASKQGMGGENSGNTPEVSWPTAIEATEKSMLD